MYNSELLNFIWNKVLITFNNHNHIEYWNLININLLKWHIILIMINVNHTKNFHSPFGKFPFEFYPIKFHAFLIIKKIFSHWLKEANFYINWILFVLLLFYERRILWKACFSDSWYALSLLFIFFIIHNRYYTHFNYKHTYLFLKGDPKCRYKILKNLFYDEYRVFTLFI